MRLIWGRRSLLCRRRWICCGHCELRRDGDKSEMLMLAATDPANPYGALLKWPAGRGFGVFSDAECGGESGALRWGSGGLSAAGESERAGVSAGGRAGADAGGEGAGGVSGGAGA